MAAREPRRQVGHDADVELFCRKGRFDLDPAEVVRQPQHVGVEVLRLQGRREQHGGRHRREPGLQERRRDDVSKGQLRTAAPRQGRDVEDGVRAEHVGQATKLQQLEVEVEQAGVEAAWFGCHRIRHRIRCCAADIADGRCESLGNGGFDLVGFGPSGADR